MKVRLSKKTWEALQEQFTQWGLDEDKFRWSSHTHLNFSNHTKESLVSLKAILDANPKVYAAKTLSRDIAIWLDVAKDSSKAANSVGRTLNQAMSMLIEYIKSTPRRHLYTRTQEGNEGVCLCYWVEEITYKDGERKHNLPDAIQIDLVWEEFGKVKTKSRQIYTPEALGLNAKEILEKMGFSVETRIIRDDYETYNEEYFRIKDLIGTQFLAVGLADDTGIDGNKSSRDDNYGWWYSSRSANVRLDANGAPARVVIDVFQEEDKDDRRQDAGYSLGFWARQANKTKQAEGDEDPELDDDDEQPEVTRDLLDTIQIPIHPYVACFDLARHKRLRIHVQNLTQYVYNTSIRDSLILPENHSKLLDTLLIEKESHFVDVIKGKSGGTIILCQGPPGTGKTLTAEIYAESLERPLYTIQCSQLGIDSDELESNLLKVLTRGRRWGAVMLLDESDVYVHQRGSDLVQNAIVGVFLRVLEYHSGVLFLTTNRGDLVDDAILSRCTARVPYGVPSTDDQRKIWRKLADINGANLSDEDLDDIVREHDRCSGRDIKNLLKLAMLVSGDTGHKIDTDLILAMRQFKPTTNFGE